MLRPPSEMKPCWMSDKFLPIIVDESTDARITVALRKAGYTIFSIQESMSGISDAEVIDYAQRINGYIITEDKDFGEQLVYNRRAHKGALLLRLAEVDAETKVTMVLATLAKYPNDLINAFAVLKKNKLRIRK